MHHLSPLPSSVTPARRIGASSPPSSSSVKSPLSASSAMPSFSTPPLLIARTYMIPSSRRSSPSLQFHIWTTMALVSTSVGDRPRGSQSPTDPHCRRCLYRTSLDAPSSREHASNRSVVGHGLWLRWCGPNQSGQVQSGKKPDASADLKKKPAYMACQVRTKLKENLIGGKMLQQCINGGINLEFLKK